jgi:hypothetical protein
VVECYFNGVTHSGFERTNKYNFLHFLLLLDGWQSFDKFTDSSADTKAYTAYDTKAKTYRHMNFFEHECYLHVRVPRIKRDDGNI